MKIQILILVLIGNMGFSAHNLLSCECMYVAYGENGTNLDHEIQNSDFIFTATIIEKLDSNDAAYYRLKIDKTWKGKTKGLMILMTGTGGCNCGLLFEIGENYLIYGDLKEGYVYTDRCSRTVKLYKTGDVDYLDYHFLQTDYDTLNFTINEINYLSKNFIGIDELLTDKSTLIYYKGCFVSKKQLLGLNPNILHVSGTYFTESEQKRLISKGVKTSMDGVLIVIDNRMPYKLKKNRLIRKMVKYNKKNR